MFRRVSFICMLAAWLCASGALLDTTQVFAWARMFAGYTRTLSIKEAAIQTMDADKPCAICLAVRRARDAERHQPPATVPAPIEKMLLACVQTQLFVFPELRPEWPDAVPEPAVSWRTAVPVPPPRTPVRDLIG